MASSSIAHQWGPAGSILVRTVGNRAAIGADRRRRDRRSEARPLAGHISVRSYAAALPMIWWRRGKPCRSRAFPAGLSGRLAHFPGLGEARPVRGGGDEHALTSSIPSPQQRHPCPRLLASERTPRIVCRSAPASPELLFRPDVSNLLDRTISGRWGSAAIWFPATSTFMRASASSTVLFSMNAKSLTDGGWLRRRIISTPMPLASGCDRWLLTAWSCCCCRIAEEPHGRACWHGSMPSMFASMMRSISDDLGFIDRQPPAPLHIHDAFSAAAARRKRSISMPRLIACRADPDRERAW